MVVEVEEGVVETREGRRSSAVAEWVVAGRRFERHAGLVLELVLALELEHELVVELVVVAELVGSLELEFERSRWLVRLLERWRWLVASRVDWRGFGTVRESVKTRREEVSTSATRPRCTHCPRTRSEETHQLTRT